MSPKPTDDPNIGSTLPIKGAIAAALTFILLLACFLLLSRAIDDYAQQEIVIATGPDTGTYHALGKEIADILLATETHNRVNIQQTDGSVENMDLLRAESPASLAFVQADDIPSRRARLVATLYDEVLHILVPANSSDSIRSIYDLEGKRLALGPTGSGTRSLSERILKHLAIKPTNTPATKPRHALEALIEGEVDAVFILSAIPSALVNEFANRGDIRFLPLGEVSRRGGEADALALVMPGVERAIIPRSTYQRLPLQAISTVSVSALLVAHAQLDEDLVQQVTAAIFEHLPGSENLAPLHSAVARNIREEFNPATVSIPYHSGATSYYHREEPPFFVEYAEALSFGLTLCLAIFSGFIAVREWFRRRMKNRVDGYLLEVEELTKKLDALSADQLEQQLAQLLELRRRAFNDLVHERLLADEAFSILQRYMRDEISDIEKRLKH